MLVLSAINSPSILCDDIVLKSIDWLGNFPWGNDDSVLDEDDKYEVCLNLKDFTSKDIQIKTSDGLLIVEGKHDDKKDEFGYISRHFVRKYCLPEDCIVEEIQSKLTTEGILIVVVPRKSLEKKDTIIPVLHKKPCYSKNSKL